MRASSICPKCNHHEVLNVHFVPDKGEYARELRPFQVAVRTVAAIRGFWNGRPEGKEAIGQLTAAVCRDCGFTEFYTANPASIPVDGELVSLSKGRPASEGPFR